MLKTSRHQMALIVSASAAFAVTIALLPTTKAIGAGDDNPLPSAEWSPLRFAEVGRVLNVGAEIVAYDKAHDTAWLTDAIQNKLRIVNLATLAVTSTIDLAAIDPTTPSPTSVAISGNLAVVAVKPPTTTSPVPKGKVHVFNTNSPAAPSQTLAVGYGPDMVTFTPNGQKVLVANEAEQADVLGGDDPEGTVSILDVSGSTLSPGTELAFPAAIPVGARRGAPSGSFAKYAEPEYISVTPDSRKAFVTLQENNAVAEINLANNTLGPIRGAGYTDFSRVGLDASDSDGPAINIAKYPALFGMRMPDGIATWNHQGKTYYATANEGDLRPPGNVANPSDNQRIKNGFFTGKLPSAWGPAADPLATALRTDAQLGRLQVTTEDPWVANGPFYAFGTRSFSVYDGEGKQVYDSGDDFERITAAEVPRLFNSSLSRFTTFDTRSDDKGPEPEGIAVRSVFGYRIAVVTLERTGGIMVYDVSDPAAPRFMQYLHGNEQNSAPEGVQIIERAGGAYILVAGEGDESDPNAKGSLTVYEIKQRFTIDPQQAPPLD